MDLATTISQLTRVGKAIAKKLEHLGVKTAQDLLYYFPFRYEDYRQILPISQLRPGQLVTICAQVELIANKRSFRSYKTITEVLVSDKTGSLRIVWFNQPFIIKNIRAGETVYFSGKVKTDMLGLKLISPIYEKFGKEKTTHTARLVPIYPIMHGLTQKQIRFLVSQIIYLADKIKDWLPTNILDQADLVPLAGALRGIHFPEDDNDLKLSVDRLKFDELFLIQLRAELSRQERSILSAPVIHFKKEAIKKFVAGLPFVLTKSQKISAWEILQDISKPTPMNRLLSGDVGSGKTVVAAMVMYSNFLNGHQSALMAPTEILARQHYDSLVKLFAGLGMNVGLLTGSKALKSEIRNSKSETNFKLETLKKQKNIIVDAINNGVIDVVVGTHALLSENVVFQKLGLVVVDEQHRFGVEQRKLIKQKGLGTHFLSMTATPIPRSLALMIYGDLDISIINELPPGRKQIITKFVEPEKRKRAYDFIREQVKSGRQIFVICPLIEVSPIEGDSGSVKTRESAGGQRRNVNFMSPTDYTPQPPSQGGVSDKKSVLAEYKKLSKNIFPDLRVGYLHGKLKSNEKEQTMSKFKDGKIDLLVTTSVIEVGVDIPNASVMMIEGAENFGLAQLHQFRGRVGRSNHQSYCLLFGNSYSQRSLERLRYFEKTYDGFKLAEKDLEMRGPGEVYGTEQSGEAGLCLAKLTDRELIKKAQDAAKIVVLNLERYSEVLDRVKDWGNRVHLE